MDSLITEVIKALGGKGSDLAKRFSSEHRAGVTKIAGHVGKAMSFHKAAMGHSKAAYKAAGDSMEDCAKALECVSKAHEIHKTICHKAAGDSPEHGEMNDHFEAAKAALTKAIGKDGDMMKLGAAHKAAHEAHLEVHDQHDLAKGAIMKVASSWVGQREDSPAAAGPGYDPAQAGHVALAPQSEMTEGEVPEYSAFEPYSGKALASPQGGGHVTEAEARLREENAALKATVATQKAAIETIGNQPAAAPAGRVFAGTTPSGADAPAGSIDALIKQLYEKGQISKLELDNFDKSPEIRQRVTNKIIGLQAVSRELGMTGFAKSIDDQGFKGNRDMIVNRTVEGAASPSAGVFKIS